MYVCVYVGVYVYVEGVWTPFYIFQVSYNITSSWPTGIGNRGHVIQLSTWLVCLPCLSYLRIHWRFFLLSFSIGRFELLNGIGSCSISFYALV